MIPDTRFDPAGEVGLVRCEFGGIIACLCKKKLSVLRWEKVRSMSVKKNCKYYVKGAVP